MKIIKSVMGSCCLCFLLVAMSVQISSCTKTKTVHDTTTVTVKDTVTLKDTITIKDTISLCSYDLTTGLVAYFNFNGGSLKDSSGLHNDIQFNNATQTTDRFGNANNAYLFNGTSSYMTVKNSPSLNPDSITLFAIVKVNGFYVSSCSGNQILSKGYPYDINGFYAISFFDLNNTCSGTPDLTNETFAGAYGDNNPQGLAAVASADTVKIKTSQWYYLTFTYDGSTAKFFINGKLKAVSGKTVGFNANAFDLFIGKHENPAFPYYFNGVIDELRIYNRALCDGAVTQLSNLKQ